MPSRLIFWITNMTTPKPITPEFLRHNDAATFLGISPALLAKQVRLGSGPPRRRIGRVVLYSVADLRTWMDALAEGAA
jgi:hypothetical protein